MTSLHYFDEYGTDTDRDSSKRSLGGQTETAMDYPQTTQSRNSSLTSTSITQYASAQQQQKDGGSEEYPRWTGRTPAVHKRRQAPEYEVTELIRMDPLHLFFLGFVPPFFGAVGSIVTRARFPSLSRIINLPVERIFWQFTFLWHIPLRCIELGVGFFRYGRLRSVACRWPRFYTLNRYLYAVFGGCELVFMIALSVVGEREFISYHVIFFYAFGCFALGFFITNVICHSNSLYYLNPYGKHSYRVKIVVSILYFVSVPILFGAFVLYWKKCITIMYDVFAVTEYIDVFLTICYHSCALFDIRHKVVFSIRKCTKVK